MSIISEAFALRRACRADYDLYLDAAYLNAHEACAGQLVNARGRALNVDPRSLFLGSADRAFLYATPELMDWWDEHRRINYRMFEEAWVGNDSGLRDRLLDRRA